MIQEELEVLPGSKVGALRSEIEGAGLFPFCTLDVLFGSGGLRAELDVLRALLDEGQGLGRAAELRLLSAGLWELPCSHAESVPVGLCQPTPSQKSGTLASFCSREARR